VVGIAAAYAPREKPMSLMFPRRFHPDAAIEAQWLGIEARLEILETGVRDFRVSLGLPGTEPRQASSDPSDALRPAIERKPAEGVLRGSTS
jgi:hypothetical protein